MPDRFCYISCVGSGRWFLHPRNRRPPEVWDYENCSEDVFDPPHVLPNGFVYDVSDTTEAIATIDGKSVTLNLEGTVALSMPYCPPGTGCSMNITFLALFADAPFVFHGRDVELIEIYNPVPMTGATVAANGDFVLSTGRSVYVSATVDGQRQGELYTSTDGMEGSIDWATREFTFSGEFLDGADSLELSFTGTIPNLPPRADAGPDQVIACDPLLGAMVQVDGSNSDDPDDSEQGSTIGDINIRRWESYETPTGQPARTLMADGEDPWLHVPPQGRRFSLVVTDLAGSSGLDYVHYTCDTSGGGGN